MDNALSAAQLIWTIVAGLVAGIAGFFIVIRIATCIRHGEYERDRKRMDSPSFYYKWKKYDVDGETDNW